LATYASDSYSVYSGADMAQVVADEYTPIRPADARGGDIAVFHSDFQHSAWFVSPVVSGGTLDENASTLSTKNGQAALKTGTLAGIRAVYPGTYEVHRRR
jgi:hypothetical protein